MSAEFEHANYIVCPGPSVSLGEIEDPVDAAYIASADPTTILSLIEEIERLRGALDKAVRILSDRELHEVTRLLDARDALVLALARSALGEG